MKSFIVFTEWVFKRNRTIVKALAREHQMAMVYSRSLRRWHGTKAFIFDPINFRSLEKEGIFSLRSKLSIILWKKRKTGEITLKAFNNVTRKEGNKLSITRLKTERVFSDCQLSLWNSPRYVHLYNYIIQKCLWAQKIIFVFPFSKCHLHGINVVDSLKWARAQIIFLPMGGSKGSFTGQLWDFEMSLL